MPPGFAGRHSSFTLYERQVTQMAASFFMPERELPADVGFSLYSPAHLMALGISLILCLLAPLIYLRLTDRGRRIMLRVLSGLMLIFEVIKELVLTLMGSMSVGYLPLHLCSVAMFICLFYACHPKHDFAGQLLYSIVIPSALGALFFPDWTMFPIWHFQSLHSFLHHTLMIQFALCPLFAREFRPGLQHIWKPLVFLCAAAIPIGIFNIGMHTNYMFLRRPSPGSPLEFLTVFPGNLGYLFGCFMLAASILILINFPFSVAEHNAIKKRKM